MIAETECDVSFWYWEAISWWKEAFVGDVRTSEGITLCNCKSRGNKKKRKRYHVCKRTMVREHTSFDAAARSKMKYWSYEVALHFRVNVCYGTGLPWSEMVASAKVLIHHSRTGFSNQNSLARITIMHVTFFSQGPRGYRWLCKWNGVLCERPLCKCHAECHLLGTWR